MSTETDFEVQKYEEFKQMTPEMLFEEFKKLQDGTVFGRYFPLCSRFPLYILGFYNTHMSLNRLFSLFVPSFFQTTHFPRRWDGFCFLLFLQLF